MKVRIGFVTNSSSYSSAVVRFDNPVVDEILNRYAKDIDFNELDTGMWSVLKTSFEENTEVKSESLFHVDEMRDDVIDTPSFLKDIILDDFIITIGNSIISEKEAGFKLSWYLDNYVFTLEIPSSGSWTWFERPRSDEKYADLIVEHFLDFINNLGEDSHFDFPGKVENEVDSDFFRF